MATVGRMAVVLTASATDFERTMGRAARSVKTTEKEFMRSARQMESIGRRWSAGITVPIVAGLTLVSKAAIDWEDAFAGVRKTVAATEAQFTMLDESLRKMTERIPLTHKEIAGIAEAAGQLGIQVENIEKFTETMAMIGTATNMASADAATALAQMDNIMQSGQQSFDRYGAAVVHLGNNLATTESKIVDFGLRIAGAGRIAGLHEAQVLAIGGAFASVGVEAEAGGTAVSKVLASMTEAAATGNEHLKWYAATAGMSAAEFASAWQDDAGEAFTRFVEGLGRSGDQAFEILRNLGLADQRLIRGFLSVAGAGDLLRRSVEMGTQAWEENVALVNEANERYRTAASRLIMLKNRLYNTAITIGGAFAPLLEIAMDKVEIFATGLQNLAEGFERLPVPIRTTIGGILILLAAIGPAYLLFGLLNRTIAGVISMFGVLTGFVGNAIFAFQSWRIGAATLGESLIFLAGGPVNVVILAIGAAIVAAILLAANWDKLRAWTVAAWNAICAAVIYAASLIVRGIGLIVTAIGYIIPAVRGAGQYLIGLANSLKASAGAALSSARSVAGTAKSAKQAAKATNKAAKSTNQAAKMTDQAAKAANKAAKAQNDVAKSGKKAAKSQNKLSKAVKDAGSSAMKNLQGFDEINQLQSEIADSAVPSADDFGIPAVPAVGAPGKIDVPSLDVPIADLGNQLADVGNIAAGIGDQLAGIADKATPAWEGLRKAIEPVNRAIAWIKEHWPTIAPIIEGIASVLLVLLIPALVKSGIEALVAAGKQVLAWVMQGAAAIAHGATIAGQLVLVVAKWVWAGVQALINAAKIVLAWAMQGLAAVAQGAVMIGQLVLVIAQWAWAGIQALVHAGQMAAAWFIALGPVGWVIAIVVGLVALIIANWDWVKEKTLIVWESIRNFFIDVWEKIKLIFSGAWDKIKSIFSIENAQKVFGNVISTIKSVFSTISEWFRGKFSDAWTKIKSIFNIANAKQVFSNVLTAIKNVFNNIPQWFHDKFTAAWTRVKNVFSSGGKVFSGIKEGIEKTFKTIVNKLISGINTIIRTPFNKINSMLNTIRNVSVLGVSPFRSLWGYNPLPVPRIPKLAKGTSYVPEDMLAYLHRGEAVVPREYNPADVSGGSAVEAALDKLAKKIASAIRDAQPAATAAGAGDVYVYIGNDQVDAYIYRSQDRRNVKSNWR